MQRPGKGFYLVRYCTNGKTLLNLVETRADLLSRWLNKYPDNIREQERDESSCNHRQPEEREHLPYNKTDTGNPSVIRPGRV
jgi:endonuclease I